ncbi:YggS family pyridoxal phosphate-dependent enzyme [Merismopedia glauca]|uniref:Pyridoxal phosphate homeostasis protein n=1 Tax=Merismopedia glauca CCAP 1448/3 TaxID=1296344 RepID=A0A2T1BXF7_9CYAN|nr:YggS family pyridoxal phosphate-dependent enzyme [Merismopedia glauca]PSB00638.1 YggS family pyridoxal phosphate-dependent enzyme [Merismopedia glauca CCAP 1448/3]
MYDPIAERIYEISQQLPSNVRLIAVSKYVSVEAMRQAYRAGIRDFGESRVQEAQIKQKQLSDLPDITWHLIGHLQSNKSRKAIELFDWIHSVDSLNLAQRLDQIADEIGKIPQVCLQVKVLPDENKYGWSIPELLTDLSELDRCQHIQIRGLMTIAPLDLTIEQTLQVFQEINHLGDRIRQQTWLNIHISELSMGMSGDYHLAIQAGSTMIRLGQVIFGERPHEN